MTPTISVPFQEVGGWRRRWKGGVSFAKFLRPIGVRK